MGCNNCMGFFSQLLRTKTYEDDVMKTPLDKCITTFELTLMGIGITVTGSFMVIGMIVEEAGSAGVISVALAGIAAMLCALSYIELSCRIPKAGSAYTYTYIAIGEFVAFIVGWAVWMEYLGGVSSGAKAWSSMLNTMTNNSISDFLGAAFNATGWPSDSQILAPYPDFPACLLVLVATALVMSGAHLSSWLISSVSLATLAVLAVIDVTLYTGAEGSNFAPSPGGFAPFGFKGVITASASAFFIYVGFDSVTIAAEEVRHPTKTIPRSVITSITAVTAILLVTVLALSLYTPYYDVTSPSTAFISAFFAANVRWAAYTAGVGGMLGLTTCVLVGSYAAPRIVYAVSRDGLLFGFISVIWQRTQVPIYAVLLSGLLAALCALLLQLEIMINYSILSAITAYTLVGNVVIALRYVEPLEFMNQTAVTDADPTDKDSLLQHESDDEDTPLVDTPIGHLRFNTGLNRILDSQYKSSKPLTPFIALGMFLVLAIVFAATVNFAGSDIIRGHWWAVLLIVLVLIGMALCVAIMMLYQQNTHTIKTFKVPLVPIVPCVGISVNLVLMLNLSGASWISYAIYVGIGLVLYFGYGFWHSAEKQKVLKRTTSST